MSLTATYNAAGAYVALAVNTTLANAVNVELQRSTDQITWTTVRGAQALPLSSGVATMNDYEFVDGVTNYYQAIYLDTTTPVYVSSAAVSKVTSSGSTVSVTPALPASPIDGQTFYVFSSCSKATATISSISAGWTYLGNTGPFAIYAAQWSAGLTAPTVTYGGVLSGDVVVAKMFSYRNTALTPQFINGESNAAGTTIPFQAVPSGLAAFILMYQASKNTSVSPTATTNDTDATSYSLLAYDGIAPPWSAGSVTVTGGVSAVSYSLVAVVAMAASLTTIDTANVVPALTSVWFKNPLAPYLNRAVTVTNVDSITNKSRSGVFDVIQRNNRVAVTDVFASRDTTLTVRTVDEPTMLDIRNCLSTGQVQFVHAPKGSRCPTGYFAFSDLVESFPSQTGTSRLLAIPVSEVAAPDPSLAAVQSTWQTVISNYATWQALVTAKASWSAVLQLVGSASDVITG